MNARTLWQWVCSVNNAQKADPWGTCTYCHQKKAKVRMIHDSVYGSFCDEACEKEWADLNAL
jgi:hypothetical protein